MNCRSCTPYLWLGISIGAFSMALFYFTCLLFVIGKPWKK